MHRRALLRIARSIAHRWPRRRPRRPKPPIHPHALALDLAPAAQWFHALSDTTRLMLLQMLAQRDRSAGELLTLGDTPSAISFHLKVLADSELIQAHREGRYRIYSLRPDTLAHMRAMLRTVTPETPALRRGPQL